MALKPITTIGFNKYELTEAEEIQAKLLSPETAAYVETMAAILADQLLAMRFSHDPVTREADLMQFVFLQGKRETLLELLGDSKAEFERLANNDN